MLSVVAVCDRFSRTGVVMDIHNGMDELSKFFTTSTVFGLLGASIAAVYHPQESKIKSAIYVLSGGVVAEISDDAIAALIGKEIGTTFLAFVIGVYSIPVIRKLLDIINAISPSKILDALYARIKGGQ